MSAAPVQVLEQSRPASERDGSLRRIARLRDQYFRHRPTVSIEKALTLTKVFKETEGEPTVIRRAKAFKKTCETKTIVIQPDELIVGMSAHIPRAGIFCPEVAWQWLNEELDTISTRSQDPYQITDEDKKTLTEVIFPYWKGKSVYEHWISQIPAETKEISVKTGIVDVEIKTQSGPGEIAPGYEDLLKRGFNGIKADAEKRLRELEYANPEHFDRINFLKAVTLCCEGITVLAARYAGAARELAKKERVEQRRTELERIAEICDWCQQIRPGISGKLVKRYGSRKLDVTSRQTDLPTLQEDSISTCIHTMKET